MCGIAGIASNRLSSERQHELVRQMTIRLAHRGPDNEGVWQDNGVCLGHRRLSIIDLSAEGNQPFLSGERYAMVYNGELYNYRELKLTLQRAEHGRSEAPFFFKTSSDTEVVLAAYQRWGAGCLQRFSGMFAFAIYDRVEQTLFIARDRMGVKPLYYYFDEGTLVFASELRAILKTCIAPFRLNSRKLAEYICYQTVFAPDTIVENVSMLLPGHYATLKNGTLDIREWWSPAADSEAEGMSYEQVCKRVHGLLAHAVQERMVADVPFGAFLSGGIDSSAVVGLMSAVSAERIRTFNVSFDESEFSESVYARAIAKKFNTIHHEIRLRPSDFLELLPEALAAMDHPGGDGPNTYVVSKATKKEGITMALSGIGGDELFAGYDIFRRMHSLNNRGWLNAVPLFVRRGVAALGVAAKPSVSRRKIAELLSQPQVTFDSAYPLSRAIFTRRQLARLVAGDPAVAIRHALSRVSRVKGRLLSAVSEAEFRTYLQNVLLRDTDQMSMAVALEVREPFLDHRLIQFVLGVNDSMKFPSTPKKLLVDSLGTLLPPEVVNRPKMGFTLPWSQWMRGELRAFCEAHVAEFARRPEVHGNAVLDLWKRFLRDDKSVPWSRVWHIVVLNDWIDRNLPDAQS